MPQVTAVDDQFGTHKLRAVLTRTGRRKGLRIELPTPQQGLF